MSGWGVLGVPTLPGWLITPVRPVTVAPAGRPILNFRSRPVFHEHCTVTHCFQPANVPADVHRIFTAWKIEKVLLHIELKRPTISTHFQRPLKELENSISGASLRRQKVDGFSNNKRSNGSNTHPLKSAILRSRASRSEVRLRRSSHCDVTATSLRRRSLSHGLTQTEWNQFRVNG